MLVGRERSFAISRDPCCVVLGRASSSPQKTSLIEHRHVRLFLFEPPLLFSKSFLFMKLAPSSLAAVPGGYSTRRFARGGKHRGGRPRRCSTPLKFGDRPRQGPEPEPLLTAANKLADYDAILPRIWLRRSLFWNQVVRQFEQMTCSMCVVRPARDNNSRDKLRSPAKSSAPSNRHPTNDASSAIARIFLAGDRNGSACARIIKLLKATQGVGVILGRIGEGRRSDH